MSWYKGLKWRVNLSSLREQDNRVSNTATSVAGPSPILPCEPPSHPGQGSSNWDNVGGSVGQESAYNLGDLGSIPGLRRSPGEGNGNPLQ